MVTLDEWPMPAKLDFSDDGVRWSTNIVNLQLELTQ
jgi:hypothetical protein